jgi:hypothetical protein
MTDYTPCHDHAAELGIAIDEGILQLADEMFEWHGMTEKARQETVNFHLDHIAYLFRPRTYRIWQRCLLALHFLGLFDLWRKFRSWIVI